MSPRRILWSLLVVFGVLAVAAALVLQLRMVAGHEREDTVDPSSSAPAKRADYPTPEVAVLTGWDRRRASAYADGDVKALRALYRPGSATGGADVRLLGTYVDRGLRVRGMRMQLLAVDVVESTPQRMVLAVTDRLVGAEAIRRGKVVPLTADRPDRRRVVMVRLDGAWVVAETRRLNGR